MDQQPRIMAKLVGAVDTHGQELIRTAEALLEQTGSRLVRLMAEYSAGQVRLFLHFNPECDGQALRDSAVFQTSAVRRLGTEGYTAVFERESGICVAHPQPELLGQNMMEAEDHSPAFRDIYRHGMQGEAKGGSYQKTMADGQVRDKYMHVLPVEGTPYAVASTTFLSELEAPLFLMRQLGERSLQLLGERINEDILQPIAALTHSARKVRNGDVSQQVAAGDPDEIGELSTAFNQMTAALKHSRTEVADKALDLEMYNDILTHDLRNAIFAIRGYQEVQLRGGEALPAAKRKHCLQRSLHLIDRSAALIDGVKTLSKIKSLEVDERAAVDLAKLVEECVEELKATQVKRPFSLDWQSEGPAWVRGTPLLKAVVTNLLQNGLQHNPEEQPWVGVQITQDGGANAGADGAGNEGRIMLTVEDNGPGIADEDKDAAFRRFEQLGGTKGSGLGLAIARNLVLKFDGQIRLEDRLEDKQVIGCRFVVLLPAGVAE